MEMNYTQYPATSSNFLLLRLIDQYKTHDRLIVAYDIDDTVRPYYSRPTGEIQSLLRMAKRVLNAYLIVYTSNPNVEEIVKFLNKNDIPYDSINENALFAVSPGAKIYYNIFLDDKAGLGQAAQILKELIDLVENGTVKKIPSEMTSEG